MSTASSHHPVRRALFAFLATFVVLGALYSGLLFFTTVRALVGQSAFPLPISEQAASTQRVSSNQQALALAHGSAPGAQDLPDIASQEGRVNILLLGTDQRAGDPGPWRADTMILVSLDPASRSASMLSIPRDLWVPIPGFGESRANMAHYLGDAYDYPGGGIALAQKTIWYALGLPVHHTIRISFGGFERLIDAIGGITVNVQEAIHDEKYPDGHYGTMVIDIPAGQQQMDGRTALQFARSRHGTGDWDRMARQQALIVAARDKIKRLDVPLSNLPEMLELAGDAVATDLSFSEMYALAQMVKEIDRSRIRHGVIDQTMTTTVITPEKWMVEVPDWDKVRQLVDDLFPAPSPSAAPASDLAKSQLASEGARISVQNGTLVVGLSQTWADVLRQEGFNVVRVGDGKTFDHPETTLVVFRDKPYTVEALATRLGLDADQIVQQPGANTDIDLLVVLGREQSQ